MNNILVTVSTKYGKHLQRQGNPVLIIRPDESRLNALNLITEQT